MEFGKNADSKAYSVQYPYTFDLFGDNRSLVFFGAVTSVAALFVYMSHRTNLSLKGEINNG